MSTLESVPSGFISEQTRFVTLLARSLVRRLPANIELDDLVQVGLLAVAHCYLSFKQQDHHQLVSDEVAFRGYAKQRIMGAMYDLLRKDDTLGRKDRSRIKLIQKARSEGKAKTGKTPTIEEVSTACGLGVEEIRTLDRLQDSSVAHSLDVGVEGDESDRRMLEGCTERDIVENEVERRRLIGQWEVKMAQMDHRHRKALEACLGYGPSPTEVAKELGISPSRVSQLFSAALASLSPVSSHPKIRRSEISETRTERRIRAWIAAHNH